MYLVLQMIYELQVMKLMAKVMRKQYRGLYRDVDR